MTGLMMAHEDNVHNPCWLRLPSLHIQVPASGGVGSIGVPNPNKSNRRSWEDAELGCPPDTEHPRSSGGGQGWGPPDRGRCMGVPDSS